MHHVTRRHRGRGASCRTTSSRDESSATASTSNRPGTNARRLPAGRGSRAAPWLLLNAGVRLDRLSTFGMHVTPRVGAVLLPRAQTAIKLLHGRAFRAPNAYERYYYNRLVDLDAALLPEQIRSSETGVGGDRCRSTCGRRDGIRVNVDRMIEQRALEDGSGDDLYFVNAGDAPRAWRRSGSGTAARQRNRRRVSATRLRTCAIMTDLPVSNSPRHLSKLGVQVPLPAVVVGLEGQYVGRAAHARWVAAGARSFRRTSP